MKNLTVIFILIGLNISLAQIIGGSESGSVAPTEVKAGVVSAGAHSGDVSLFTGAYGASHTLGTVSTVSGLSFTLNLNYSSTFSAGDNVPLIRGIGYGEGWDLGIPSVSVTSEQYTHFTAQRIYNEAQYGDTLLSMGYEDWGNDGKSVWMAPVINIPGVASGRFVYKYTDDRGHVFVPNQFESYVEAIYNGSTWDVVLTDGTVYELSERRLNVRNPKNQRRLMNGDLGYQYPSAPVDENPVFKVDTITHDSMFVFNEDINDYEWIPHDTTIIIEHTQVPFDGALSQIWPKNEVVEWYVSRIYNPNHAAGQSINFSYARYGAFDYFKEYYQRQLSIVFAYQYLGRNNVYPNFNLEEEVPFYSFMVHSDLQLTQIYTNDYTGVTQDELVLEYATFLDPQNKLVNTLDFNDPNVYRKDSLYNYSTVYAVNQNQFNNWRRYRHGKSDEVQQTLNNGLIPVDELNPYKISYNGQSNYYREDIGNEPNGVPFDHSYLESEFIPFAQSTPLVSGDLYELRTEVYNPNKKIGNMDINVVGIKEYNISMNCNTTTQNLYCTNEIDSKRSRSVYSTFGNGIKWNIADQTTNSNNLITSNFFSLENLSNAFTGLAIQVGPGNADIKYDATLVEASELTPLQYTDPNIYSVDASKTYFANNEPYYNANAENIQLWPLKPHQRIPANFGIGLPWEMTKRFYDDVYYDNNPTSVDRYKFWWNDNYDNSSNFNWENEPTAFDESVKLKKVELIRYSKNPYMLSSVKQYSYNGVRSDKDLEGDKYLTSQLDFEYDVMQDHVLSNRIYNDNETPELKQNGEVNVMVLTKVKRVPTDPTKSVTEEKAPYDIAKVPTTHYDYTMYEQTQFIDNFFTNGNVFPMTKITDQLGGETTIEYYPYHSDETTITNVYKRSKYDVVVGTLDGDDPGINHAKSITMVVKSKSMDNGKNTPLDWQYEYANREGYEELKDLDGHVVNRSQRIRYGFKNVTVYDPIIEDGQSLRSYTKYTHFVDEFNRLLFGKVKSVADFTATGEVLRSNTFEYEFDQVYRNGVYRTDRNIPDETDYNGYSANVGTGYAFSQSDEPVVTFFANYNQDFLEIINPNLFDENYLSSWFVKLKKSTESNYEYAGNEANQIGIASDDILNGVSNISKISNAIKAQQSCIVDAVNELERPELLRYDIVTEYDYWEAGVDGRTTMEGYKRLLPEFTGNAIDLTFEPSWQLYSTKTYSPQFSGAFSEQEYYYFHDLKNYFGNVPYEFEGLYYADKDHIRALVYQQLNTTKAPNKEPLSKSTYFEYDARWNINNYSITPLVVDTTFSIVACNVDTTEVEPTDPCLDGGCEPVKYIGQLPPAGYVFKYCDGNWYQCPSSVDPKVPNVGQWLANRLFFRRAITQIDTLELSAYWGLTNRAESIPVDSSLTPSDNLPAITDYPIVRFYKNQRGVYVSLFPYDTLTTSEINRRWELGQPSLLTDVSGLQTRVLFDMPYSIFYNDTLCPDSSYKEYYANNAFAPKMIVQGSGLVDSLVVTYDYYGNYGIKSLIDPNGSVIDYTYDNYGRLYEARSNGDLISRNNYNNWENELNQSFEARSYNNYVESYVFKDAGSMQAVRTRAYVDPLGRNFHSAAQITVDADSSYLDNRMIRSGWQEYDNWGRVTKAYKPFVQEDVNPIDFTPYNYPLENLLHTTTDYEDDKRSRVLRTSQFGEDIQTGHISSKTYDIIKGNRLRIELGVGSSEMAWICEGDFTNQLFLKELLFDEDNRRYIQYSNVMGQLIATKGYSNNTTDVVTFFIYDSWGNLTQSVNARMQPTTYKYNMLGQLYEEQTVDAGITRFMYDKAGNVVLRQDENGRAGMHSADTTAYMTYFEYDDFNRLTKQSRVKSTPFENHNSLPMVYADIDGSLVNGHFSNNSTYLWKKTISYVGNFIHNTGFINLNANDVIKEKESFYGENTTLPSVSSVIQSVLNSDRTNLKGKLSHSSAFDHLGNLTETTFYSYDLRGNLKWEIKSFVGDTNDVEYIIHYENYDLMGNFKEQVVDMDLDSVNNMVYTINLDDWSRLESVQALGKTIVSYSYDDALGLITAKKHYAINDNSKIADEITYAYDDRNRLTSINSALFDWYMYYDNNHPQLDTDPFKVNSDENYNGNINATKAVYKLDQTNLGALPGNLFKGETVYGYQYDGLNRLTNADATVMDNFITGGLNDESMKVYGDVSFTYDNIGNITSLNRNHFSNELAATSDQWIYTYEPAKNKLLSVNGSSSRNYTYDLSGNLLTDDFKSLDNTVYGRANLPTLLSKADETILYGYDINDDRMYVRVDSLTTTKSKEYYIKDVSGRTLAVYDLLQDKRQWYGFGKDRVAELKVNENSTGSTLVGISYFVQDHLGNTRVKYIPTYNAATTEVDYYVENVIDFFPYGKVLREYNPASDARYVSTHHERDDETGFDYRGARFYDSDVARFMVKDPLYFKQLMNSPYNYVRGNPLSRVDPTGLTDYRVDGEVKTIDDGYDNVIVYISSGEYDKLSRSWNGGQDNKYFRQRRNYMNNYGYVTKSFKKNGYTTMDGTVYIDEIELTYYSPLENPATENDSDWSWYNNITAPILGGGVTSASLMFFDKKSGTWMGKDFKTRSTSWGGNQHTGGKYKFARKASRGFAGVSIALGVVGFVKTEEKYQNGKYNQWQRVTEQGTNVYSALGGLPGAAWGIGWGLGEEITETSSYQQWKQESWLPFRMEYFDY